jgi:hypothetical protein
MNIRPPTRRILFNILVVIALAIPLSGSAYPQDTNPARMQSLTAQKELYDSSLSAKVTIQQIYDEMTYQGKRYVKVYYYRVRWVRLDPAVSWKNAKIYAGCFGWFYPSKVTCDKNEAKSIGSPTSGTWYKMTPSWAGQYVIVGNMYSQDGRADITLVRGSTNWKLFICIEQGSGSC